MDDDLGMLYTCLPGSRRPEDPSKALHLSEISHLYQGTAQPAFQVRPAHVHASQHMLHGIDVHNLDKAHLSRPDCSPNLHPY